MAFLSRLRVAYKALTGQVRIGAAMHPAAESGRRLKNWTPTSADINTILSQSGNTLVCRARDLVATNAYAANAKEEFTSALVGTGIKAACTLEDRDLCRRVQDLWSAWCEEADADGVLSLCGLQDIAAGAMFDAGEVFLRLRDRRPEDGLTVPLQVQALETEFLDRSYTVPLSNGHQVKSGMEFDRIGRRVAYWFWRQHPGDQLSMNTFNERVRVPAENVLHIYEVTRPGQIRGVPKVIAGMIRLKLLDDYDDAELDRKKIAALYAGFITTPENFDEVHRFANEETPDGDGLAPAELQPGSMHILEPGEDVKFSDPADVGGSYEAFQFRNLLAIAAALGVSYSGLTGDVSRANYSSLRADMVRLRRRIMRLQQKTLVHQFCRPLWQRFVRAAVLSRALPAGVDIEALSRAVLWIPPKWEWVDPLKDRQAEKLAMDMGVKPRSAVIIEEGGDPETVDQQIAADQERADRLGLRLGQANAPAVPMEEDEEEEGEEDTEQEGQAARRMRSA